MAGADCGWREAGALRMNTRDLAAASGATPANCDPRDAVGGKRKFSVGEKVQYNSQTHQQLMPAVVKDVIYNDNKEVAFYNLDVKSNASPARVFPVQAENHFAGQFHSCQFMSEMGVPTPLVNNALRAGGGPARTGSTGSTAAMAVQAPEEGSPARLQLPVDYQVDVDLECTPSHSPSGAASRAASPDASPVADKYSRQFEVGEFVEYFSSTYQRWMPAKVLDVKPNGTYTLDVKKGAAPSKMRPLPACRIASPSVQVRDLQQVASSPPVPFMEEVSVGLSDRLEAPRLAQQRPSTRQLVPDPSLHADFHGYSDLPEAGHEAVVDMVPAQVVQRRPSPGPVYRVLPATSAPMAAPMAGSCAPVLRFMGTGTEFRPRPSGHQAMQAGRAGQSNLVPVTAELAHFPFDPLCIRLLLCESLGVSVQSSITKLTGFQGGQNEGVWFLTDTHKNLNLVLKLVRGDRKVEMLLTEAENLLELEKKCPGLASDPHVAFPIKLFNFTFPATTKRYDLIVMRQVPGEQLNGLIAKYVFEKRHQDLCNMLSRVGSSLAEFHLRYNLMNHGDFQPMNIFYKECTQEVFLIDIGGMGVPTTETDVEHLIVALRKCGETYDQALIEKLCRIFEDSYNRRFRQ